ncbi:unnamed protein product [Sphagnum balticum]
MIEERQEPYEEINGEGPSKARRFLDSESSGREIPSRNSSLSSVSSRDGPSSHFREDLLHPSTPTKSRDWEKKVLGKTADREEGENVEKICGNIEETPEHNKAVLEALSRNPRAFGGEERGGGTFALGVPLAEVRKGTCLYIGNIDRRVTQEKLEALFAEYGQLDYCYIVYEPHSVSERGGKPEVKQSRGYGFAKYRGIEEARKAQEKLNGLDLNGRRMNVEFSKRNKPRESTPG